MYRHTVGIFSGSIIFLANFIVLIGKLYRRRQTDGRFARKEWVKTFSTIWRTNSFSYTRGSYTTPNARETLAQSLSRKG